MIDPRVDKVLEHIGEVDNHGKPTELAMVAGRVQAHVEAVGELRQELDAAESGIADVVSRAQVLAESLSERARHGADLQYEAQDTTVRAALSGSSAGAAQLRNQALRKRQNIAEFEKDFAEDKKRLEHARETLRNRQQRIRQIRDQIARRMNTVDILLQRADATWPAESQSPARRDPGARPAQRPAAHPAPRRAPRPMARQSSARRVVVRRRKAS